MIPGGMKAQLVPLYPRGCGLGVRCTSIVRMSLSCQRLVSLNSNVYRVCGFLRISQIPNPVKPPRMRTYNHKFCGMVYIPISHCCLWPGPRAQTILWTLTLENTERTPTSVTPKSYRSWPPSVLDHRPFLTSVCSRIGKSRRQKRPESLGSATNDPREILILEAL